jgi:hypothetical protein
MVESLRRRGGGESVRENLIGKQAVMPGLRRRRQRWRRRHTKRRRRRRRARPRRSA